MTDRIEKEELDAEIAELVVKREALNKPLGAEDVKRMAREDPDGFNRLYDEGKIPASALGAPTKMEED
jgi:hypothetical protein